MMDEVDKIGADFRGDPSSALLEVLDPEQNNSFRDHYLGVPFDLSNVMFICTANLTDTIQPAFLDRMEVIRLAGYTEDEKLEIARRHLVPKQLDEHGLNPEHLRVHRRGAARRSSTRTPARRACGTSSARSRRSRARWRARSPRARPRDRPRHARLASSASSARPRSRPEERLKKDAVGIATGLAWTATGGDMLFVEATLMKGKGRLTLTGHLGDVMKESAQAALSYARSHARQLRHHGRGLRRRTTSTSTCRRAPSRRTGPRRASPWPPRSSPRSPAAAVRAAVAMTGEITLRGQVLPIGGLKEKILAARRAGIETIVCPRLNQQELEEVPGPPAAGHRVPPRGRRGRGAEAGAGAAAGAEAGDGREERSEDVPRAAAPAGHGVAAIPGRLTGAPPPGFLQDPREGHRAEPDSPRAPSRSRRPRPAPARPHGRPPRYGLVLRWPLRRREGRARDGRRPPHLERDRHPRRARLRARRRDLHPDAADRRVRWPAGASSCASRAPTRSPTSR